MTTKLYTQKEWALVGLSELVCEELDGVIYFTNPSLGTMAALDVATLKLVRINTAVTALFSDFANGILYAALPPAAGQIAKCVQLLAGATYRTARWRSKRIVLPSEAGYSWLAVEGEQSPGAPLTMNLYGYYTTSSGTEVQTQLLTDTQGGGYSANMTNTRPIRVASGRYKDYEMEISGACRVTSVVLASSLDELKEIN